MALSARRSSQSHHILLFAAIAVMAVALTATLASEVRPPPPAVLLADGNDDEERLAAASRAGQPDVAATILRVHGTDGQGVAAAVGQWATPLVIVLDAQVNVPTAVPSERVELWVLVDQDARLGVPTGVLAPGFACEALEGVAAGPCDPGPRLSYQGAAATGTAGGLREVMAESELIGSVDWSAVIAPDTPVPAARGRPWHGVGVGLLLLFFGLIVANRMAQQETASRQSGIRASAVPTTEVHGARTAPQGPMAADDDAELDVPGERVTTRTRGHGGVPEREELEQRGRRYEPTNWVDPHTNPDADHIEPVVTAEGDGAGRSWVLASARGTRHTLAGKPNQDRAAVRSVLGDRYLLAAVADGVGSCPLAHCGSQAVIELALEATERQLAEGAEPHDLNIETIANATVAGFARKWPEADLRNYGTTLALAVIPADSGLGWAGRVGDSTILTLDEKGSWRDSFPARPGSATDALPMQPDRGEQCLVDTSGFVLPVTDGLLAALTGASGEGIRALFSQVVLAGLTDGQQLYEVMTNELIHCGDDRTMVVASPTRRGI